MTSRKGALVMREEILVVRVEDDDQMVEYREG